MSVRRYEISILIGPCSQEEAVDAARAAHAEANRITHWPATSLNFWDDEAEQPGLPVPGVDVFG